MGYLGMEMQMLGAVKGDRISCFRDGIEIIKLTVEKTQIIWGEAIECFIK